MKFIKYCYHASCAAVLNARASRHSKRMKNMHLTPKQRSDASKALLDVGSRSNYHEWQRDKYR